VKSAEILEKQKDQLGAATKYTEAGLCMARVDNGDAIRLLEMGIAIHTSEARLGAAARVWKELAQLHEEDENMQDAIDAWRKAADAHESEGTLANCLQCLLHVGELHIKVGDTGTEGIQAKRHATHQPVLRQGTAHKQSPDGHLAAIVALHLRARVGQQSRHDSATVIGREATCRSLCASFQRQLASDITPLCPFRVLVCSSPPYFIDIGVPVS